ncbi:MULTISPECIES: 2Fe-2S iron-sulfur cluster-binding protein [unclassified Streptomyces]|uniref:2Fe-2S iron-sulfur cluster-binding protein n=1 Tax=Streptomyces sp. NBC_00119 TaxID=2975659 RepID=A0AAU1UDU4_9ACTN|nr:MULTISPECIES: 2Fe-2S iron-sulfur cluster-binding protein [unclassified Streptomyces]MCX4645134.1 2Fe-2S iron-sulfur cluster-binding protein [Streptomyces sp. NBC_01446]MCX5326096.1 2Fe-2S iron-sulfur cluster-binding protein [Streptomyces sp. NBC_00120]
MTDEHNHGGHQGGGWEPLPQGDYDADATAFVQLPEGGLPDVPLAAPGHGYVPPQITIAPGGPAATDPAATGVWVLPPDVTGAQAAPTGAATGEVHWPEPAEPAEHAEPAAPEAMPSYGHGAGVTGQWNFSDAGHQAPPAHGDAVAEPAGQAGQTGQWSIPVIAEGDLPDESGEFTTSSIAAQWGRTPPATLPGGAVAPWAAEEWAREPSRGVPEDEFEPEFEPEAEPEVAPEVAPEPAQVDVSGIHAVHGERGEHGGPEPFGTADGEAHAFADVAAESAEEPVRVPTPEASQVHEVHEVHEVPEDSPAPAAPAAPVVEETPEVTEAPAPEDAAADGPAPDAVVAPLHDDHPLASYVLRVNGTDRPVTGAWIGESLLYVLRERLGLAGAKDGCSQGECGACNVQVDGRLVASCLVPGATAAGSEVRTVEGLAADGQPSDVQRALAARCAVQCGFCVPGMAMTVHDLLEGNPAPTELEARQALCGNLCRCSGYRGILDAVQQVVTEREATATGATTATDSTGPTAFAGDAGGEARIPHQAGPSATEGIQDGGLA